MKASAGYSGTPFAKKLGIKEVDEVWSGLKLVLLKENRASRR